MLPNKEVLLSTHYFVKTLKYNHGIELLANTRPKQRIIIKLLMQVLKGRAFHFPRARHNSVQAVPRTKEQILWRLKFNWEIMMWRTLSAQSTRVINIKPGWTASGPLKSLATFSYWGCKVQPQLIIPKQYHKVRRKSSMVIPCSFCKRDTYKTSCKKIRNICKNFKLHSYDHISNSWIVERQEKLLAKCCAYMYAYIVSFNAFINVRDHIPTCVQILQREHHMNLY